MDGGYTVREGIVLFADGGRLVVRVERGADEDCGGCRACSLKSLCKGRENGKMDLEVTVPAEEGAPAYRPGDVVTVEYTQANAAVAATVMFVPALAGLALGGWLANSVGGDGVLLSGCALGFAAGVGLSWLIARRTKALRPEVRVFSKETRPGR